MWMDKNASPCILMNFEWPTLANVNILNMRTMIYVTCHRNENKFNQKFVLLKVASDKKFGQHFP